jgi:hypothetical protein
MADPPNLRKTSAQPAKPPTRPTHPHSHLPTAGRPRTRSTGTPAATAAAATASFTCSGTSRCSSTAPVPSMRCARAAGSSCKRSAGGAWCYSHAMSAYLGAQQDSELGHGRISRSLCSARVAAPHGQRNVLQSAATQAGQGQPPGCAVLDQQQAISGSTQEAPRKPQWK